VDGQHLKKVGPQGDANSFALVRHRKKTTCETPV